MTLSLPPITMVFCCVDGGKAFASRNRTEAHEVHCIIASIIRNTLCQVCARGEGGIVWQVLMYAACCCVTYLLLIMYNLAPGHSLSASVA
jgi:hypothetical protein